MIAHRHNEHRELASVGLPEDFAPFISDRPRKSRAAALALVLALLAAPTWGQQVFTTGDANPAIPLASSVDLSGTHLLLGGPGASLVPTGELKVLSGGTLSVAEISTGYGGAGNGAATIDGAGSIVTFVRLGASTSGLDVGSWGTGSMSVTAGGKVVCTPANCPSSQIGSGAGSTGTLTINGTGSSVTGLDQLTVGGANVITGFGTQGGTTTGTLRVEDGAILGTGFSTISPGGSGALANGNEHTTAIVTIDGAGSQWQIARATPTAAQAGLVLAATPNATATLDVTNGGVVTITGSRANPPGTDNTVPFINMAGSLAQAGGTATINVTGPGSAIVFDGDTGVFNVGRNTGTAALNITDGGKVYGNGSNGLVGMFVARLGATATLNVDGADSRVTLSGVGGVNTTLDNLGAFLRLGTNGGSTSTATVTNGGAIVLSDGGHDATAGGVGIVVGRDLGDSGSLTVSGVNSVSGAHSRITIEQTGANSTASPGMTIAGTGSGEVIVTDGGVILIHNDGLAAAGGGTGITIARDTGSSGSLTVSGVGSSLTIEQGGIATNNPGITVGRAGTGEMLVTDGATVAVNGSIQRNFVVGNAAGGNGTLTVSNGAAISASWFTVGNNGGTGLATIDNADVNINGVSINSQTNEITGGGFRVGRGPGSVGTLTLVNSAHIKIDTSTTTPEIYLGGTGVLPGGNGTVNMSGGSSVAFTGTGATPQVVIGHSGTGLWTMDGGSTLSVPISGKIVIGSTPTGNGTMTMTGGSSIDTGMLHVGGSGLGSFSMDSGTLTIRNNDINVNAFIVGNHAGSVDTFTQTGGDVLGGRSLTLGNDGGTGTYNLNTGTNPTLDVGIITLGFSGTGTFNQQAGTTVTTGNIFIGTDNGTYNLQGGNLSVLGGQGTIVGTFNVGNFNQSGGDFLTDNLIIGNTSASRGTYDMSGGTLTVLDTIFVGRGDSSFDPGLAGLFTQTGGDVSAAGIRIGGDYTNNESHYGRGRYELVDGTVTSQFTEVGSLSQGAVLQTGGTFNAGSLVLGGAGLFAIGADLYSSGVYDLQGGALNTNGTTVSGLGAGTFNQSGTSVHTVTGNLIVGSQPCALTPDPCGLREGTYTMAGGTLSVNTFVSGPDTLGGNVIIGGGNGIGADPGFPGERGAKGTFVQSGGSVTTGADMTIGQAGSQGGGTGSYQLSGGQLTVNGQLTVGDGGNTVAGNGTFLQTGGQVTANALVVGSNGGRPGVIGTYTLNAGDVVVTDLAPGGGVTYIGGFAAGTMTQNGGTFTSNFVNVGILGDSHGTYTLNDGTVNANFNLGVGGNGTGSFVQNGGHVFVNSPDFGLFVGGNTGGFATPGSTGTYTLNAGDLNVVNSTYVGNDGVGTFNQTGGTHTIGANNGTSDAGKQNLYLGSNANGNGTYNMSGGALTVWGNSASNNSAITVGAAGTGLFVQTGGAVNAHGFNSLAIGEFGGGSGEYRISNGSLATTGNAFVGAHSQGAMLQTGGAVTVGGDLLVGYASTAVGQYTMNATAGNGASTLQVGGNLLVGVDGNGTLSMSGGSGIVLTGSGATAIVGQSGTGLMTMIEGSTLQLGDNSKVIVGANAGASGTLELQGGSSIQLGSNSVFGIAHDGTNSTGATANVYLDQGSSITATNIFLGDGCLGGNGGVIHGNFTMNGAAAVVNCAPPVLPIAHPDLIDPTGILHPGRSPGVLTFDGSFLYLAGTIVLQVQSDGSGGFLTDEIVFTSGTVPNFANANIEFSFLGNTNPNDFVPFWNLDTFLKTVTAGGAIEGISELGNLDNMFSDATFVAQSDAYVITNFTFDPEEGVTSVDADPVVTVPEPASMMLVLLGGFLLVLFTRRRASAPIARRT